VLFEGKLSSDDFNHSLVIGKLIGIGHVRSLAPSLL
jgi:hypothetical protein